MKTISKTCYFQIWSREVKVEVKNTPSWKLSPASMLPPWKLPPSSKSHGNEYQRKVEIFQWKPKRERHDKLLIRIVEVGNRWKILRRWKLFESSEDCGNRWKSMEKACMWKLLKSVDYYGG